jgi:hypothetical protein
MDQRNRKWAAAAVALGALLAMTGAAASPSNKWRIQVSGGAESAGAIVLAVTPVDGPPESVTVEVADGTSENQVAKTIRDAIRGQLGQRYKAEVDDGEDVLVKRHMGGPKFELTLTSNTVQGVRLNFDKE